MHKVVKSQKCLDKSSNIIDILHPGPSLFWQFELFLAEKCELNWKYPILSIKNSETKPFATCGEWRMGWTTLLLTN
jgi:hypothetical protein